MLLKLSKIDIDIKIITILIIIKMVIIIIYNLQVLNCVAATYPCVCCLVWSTLVVMVIDVG
jgi:hypothetical protein